MPTQTHTTSITALFSNGNNIWDLASREQMHAVLAGHESFCHGPAGPDSSYGALAPFLAELRAYEAHQERLELFHLLGQSRVGMSLTFKDCMVFGSSRKGKTYTVLAPLVAELDAINPLLHLREGPARQEPQYGVGLVDALGDWSELESILESIRAERRERAGH